MTRNIVKSVTAAAFFLLLSTSFTSCGPKEPPDGKGDPLTGQPAAIPGKPAEEDTAARTIPAATGTAVPAPKVEVSIFEIRGKNGRLEGYGYDLIVNGKKTIHQPTIPAVQGNYPFFSEQDAQAVGELAASRMRKTGDLPTIRVQDLDSLKIVRI